MRKQIWLLAVSFGAMSASLFLAGCGGGGGQVTLNPADKPPPPPAPVVNVPAGMRGTIVFSGPSDLSSGKGNAIYALSASKGLEKVDEATGGMCFSPDGRYLSYVRDTGEIETYSVGAATVNRAIYETVIADRNWNRIRAYRDLYGGYSWSPSGRFLLFGCRSEGIYSVDMTTWEITKLVVSDGGASLLSPGMSLDESVLVWTRYKQGEELTIFRSPISGRLTITILEVVFPTGSRSEQNTVNLFLDSNQMLYVVDDSVLLGNIGSSQSWQVAKLPMLRAIKLSPNKQKLACLTPDTLYVYEVGSWQEQKVGSNPSRSNSDLAWSPDSNGVVVTEENYQITKSTEVILYDFQGGKRKLASLFSAEAGKVFIDWAP